MGESSRLIGRADALRVIDDALAEAERGWGQLLLITGEAGIGKSALADVVARRATERAATVLFGRAWELGDAPPYFPLWSGLRALGLAPPAGAPADVDAFHAWERVLAALPAATATRPVVWILEDLHAADLLTLDLIAFLARPIRALPVLLIVTARDLDPRRLGPIDARLARLARDGHELRLGPLDAAAAAALAEAAAGRSLAPAESRQLVELAGGNPLFLIECARDRKAAAHRPLPPTIRALVDERVALLGEATREALVAGAILGRDFAAATVARMLDGPMLPAQVIERLTPAVRAGFLLDPRPGQFRFSHILVRDALEDALGPVRRAELHAAALSALAPAMTADSPDLLVERARHALSVAHPGKEAVTLALQAARALAGQGAFDRALALYARLEDAAAAGVSEARAPLDEALQRAAVARSAGRHAEARRRVEAVVEQARAAGDTRSLALAALEMGAELRPGMVDAGLVSALQDALTGPSLDAELRCRLEARLAAALQPSPDPSWPVTLARQALAAARLRNTPALLLEVLQNAGSAMIDYVPVAEQAALAAELRDAAERAGDLPRALLGGARLALDHAVTGDFAAFEADVDRLQASSAALGHPRWRWRPLVFASMRALMRGDTEESDRCLVEVREQASVNDAPALGTSLAAHSLNRALLFHRDQEAWAALGRLEETLEAFPERELIVHALRAGVLAKQEDAAGAGEALVRLRGRLPVGITDLRYLLVEACALVGSDDERRSLLRALEPHASEHFLSGHVPLTYEGPVLRGLALLASSLGQHAGGLARLDQARGGAEARGHRPWVAQMQYDRARILAAMGRTGEAAVAFGEALAAAERVGMPGLASRIRARLQGEPPAGATVAQPARATESPSLHREGELWRVQLGLRSVRVRHSRGLELLARLMERPGEEIHVLALASDGGGALVEGSPGEVLDAQARREYQRRLSQLERALDEAEADHDLGRRAQLAAEHEALRAELSRALGLGGRARQTTSATERARVNAQRRLKDAVTRITEADAVLGTRLEAGLHTGTYCSFRP